MEKTKIMVVDDEKEMLRLMTSGLEGRGFDVDAYSDPLAAISSFTASPGRYHFVLLDVRMLGLDGFEVYRRLREISYDVKIGFLTGFDVYMEQFKRLFPDLRIEFFLRKPVPTSELSERISVAMGEGTERAVEERSHDYHAPQLSGELEQRATPDHP